MIIIWAPTSELRKYAARRSWLDRVQGQKGVVKDDEHGNIRMDRRPTGVIVLHLDKVDMLEYP